MLLYVIIFIALAILAAFELPFKGRQKRVKLPVFIGVSLFFILMSGLRWNTGADWTPYLYYYTHYDPSILFFRIAFEPGFGLFVRFLRIFSDSFTFYLIVFALFTIGLRALFFYRYTNAILLSLFLFWGIGTFAEVFGVRQSLAISLCLSGVPLIIKRRFWFFALVVLLATSIHTTAIIFLAAYPVFHAKWSVRTKSILLVLSIIIGIVGGGSLLLSLFSSIPGLGRFAQKATDYMEMGTETNWAAVSKTQQLLIGIFKRALIIPVFLYYEKYMKERSPYYKGFLNLYVFGNAIYFVVGDFLSLQRLAGYFYPLEILLLCLIFEHSKKKIIWFSILLIYCLLKYSYTLYSGSGSFIPYFWIFTEDMGGVFRI